ncbi:hypothetical protein MLD38_006064 [Melastoma candidum]|uniref:Uncharacterized protein n=1 Tax=Melastoma candidum TaxID=119954 RepID=A0ACB9RQW4_9MYRT|nr:hypothetical protein MLD38_006064 [Melastoma candidum]
MLVCETGLDSDRGRSGLRSLHPYAKRRYFSPRSSIGNPSNLERKRPSNSNSPPSIPNPPEVGLVVHGCGEGKNFHLVCFYGG